MEVMNVNKHIGNPTDYVIVDTSFVGNTRVVSNNAIYVVKNCYQGGSTVHERKLNISLGMVETVDTVCIIEKELLLAINENFYQINQKGFVDINNFKGEIVTTEINGESGDMVNIVFNGTVNNNKVEYILSIPFQKIKN